MADRLTEIIPDFCRLDVLKNTMILGHQEGSSALVDASIF
jgi:hypothetical protein